MRLTTDFTKYCCPFLQATVDKYPNTPIDINLSARYLSAIKLNRSVCCDTSKLNNFLFTLHTVNQHSTIDFDTWLVRLLLFA